ncbi:unnamed protein product, partial [Prunus brigantina]
KNGLTNIQTPPLFFSAPHGSIGGGGGLSLFSLPPFFLSFVYASSQPPLPWILLWGWSYFVFEPVWLCWWLSLRVCGYL